MAQESRKVYVIKVLENLFHYMIKLSPIIFYLYGLIRELDNNLNILQNHIIIF